MFRSRPWTGIFFVFCIAFWLAVSSAGATTWNVNPDGSGDVLTIQAGLDSSVAGDTVLVAAGTYYESGLHNLKSGVVLVSTTGGSGCAIIDGQREYSVFACWGCDSTSVIQGFTITGGQSREDETPPGAGGGMKCHSSVRVVNCLFIDNVTYGYGGAVHVDAGRPTFQNCTFSGNMAATGGAIQIDVAGCSIIDCTFLNNFCLRGTVCCGSASPEIVGCTFFGNTAEDHGSGISCRDFSSPRIDRTLIAGGVSGEAVDCDQWSHPTLSCCNLFGNVEGDWTGPIATQNGLRGNFSADPRFCDVSGGVLSVESCSPCLPGHHPHDYDCGGAIGRWGAGCECEEASRPTSWGAIKAIYR